MKISSRNKTLLQILGIIGIGAVTTVSMLYPEALGNDLSIRSIQDKNDELERHNTQLISNENTMKTESERVRGLKEGNRPLQEEYERLTTGIADTDFTLHIPSLLMALERGATENNVTLTIEYDEIQTASGDVEENHSEDYMSEDIYDNYGEYDNDNETERDAGHGNDPLEEELLDGRSPETMPFDEDDDMSDPSERPQPSIEPDESVTTENGQGGDELVEANLVDAVPDSEEKGSNAQTQGPVVLSEHPEVDLTNIRDNIPVVPGVSVTTVPLRVNGSFADIRAFILFIDDIDFIEHNLIDLYSFGDEVSGVIVLNVFHTENGGSLY